MENQIGHSTQTVKSLLTVKQFAEKHQAFTENSIRWLIFNRSSNGFGPCFCKVGEKRILIDEAAFFAKIEGNRMDV